MSLPISIEELCNKIREGEQVLKSDLYDESLFIFWKNIKFGPEKWEDEEEFSKEQNGFFVVGIAGHSVIWYNDIEDGFNISFYNDYGFIRDYDCEQWDLNHAVSKLYYRK